MSTAASADWGRSASSELKNNEQRDDDAGADQRGELGFGPGLLDDCRARPARRDGESLKEAGGEVGGADPDHLLVGVHLLAPPSAEARGGGDRVGQTRRA